MLMTASSKMTNPNIRLDQNPHSLLVLRIIFFTLQQGGQSHTVWPSQDQQYARQFHR
jgi:hypothetical protein